MNAQAIARDIRLRLGDRVAQPAEVLAEIERLVAERPSVGPVRVAVERELLRDIARAA